MEFIKCFSVNAFKKILLNPYTQFNRNRHKKAAVALLFSDSLSYEVVCPQPHVPKTIL